jgi:hypothetical protein
MIVGSLPLSAGDKLARGGEGREGRGGARNAISLGRAGNGRRRLVGVGSVSAADFEMGIGAGPEGGRRKAADKAADKAPVLPRLSPGVFRGGSGEEWIWDI